jgi:hypothetical protein
MTTTHVGHVAARDAKLAKLRAAFSKFVNSISKSLLQFNGGEIIDVWEYGSGEVEEGTVRGGVGDPGAEGDEVCRRTMSKIRHGWWRRCREPTCGPGVLYLYHL